MFKKVNCGKIFEGDSVLIGNSKGEIKSKVVEIDSPDDGLNTIERVSFVIIRRLTMLKVKKSEK